MEPHESKTDEDKEITDEKSGNTNKSISGIRTRAQKRKLAESQNTESEKAQSEKALSEKQNEEKQELNAAEEIQKEIEKIIDQNLAKKKLECDKLEEEKHKDQP